jgi:CO/xanthine dehydrogenase Mo-binding subunit
LSTETKVAGGWVGKPLRRREEARLIQGRGQFVDDYKFPGALHMRLVRSPYGHAKITRINVSRAEAYPGVVCTLTGAEVVAQTQSFLEIGPGTSQNIKDYCMAAGKVRYQGEPVVAVVAATRMAAEDAAE